MRRRRVKLGLYGLTVGDIVPYCRAITEKMSGNLNYPNPNPDLALVNLAIDELAQADVAAEDGGKTAIALVQIKKANVFNQMRILRDYVNLTGDGVEEALLSSGFPLANLPSPITLLMPANVRTKTLDGQGKVRIMCNKVAGATGYQVRYRLVGRLLNQNEPGVIPVPDNRIEGWQYADPQSSLNQEMTGLLSAVYHEFQMRATGSGKPGPWSGSVEGLPA